MASSNRADDAPRKFETSFNLVGILALHVGALIAFAIGVRTIDLVLAAAFYWVRMFAITAGYHRYFSHRAFNTSRTFQFLLALVGTTATQKGPLWWAATHRKHHRWSDTPGDVHSPVQRGFWYSHIGWVLSSEHERYDAKSVKDLSKFAELRWLDRWHAVPVLAFIVLTGIFGGLRGITWWYCVSTVALLHGTFTVNSLAHVWGVRRFSTQDDSRNNWLLALLTLGEGWHNNHHRYMQSAAQGFYWWQVDVSYYILRALSLVGVVSNLKLPPTRILDEGRRGTPVPFAKAGAPMGSVTLHPVEAALVEAAE